MQIDSSNYHCLYSRDLRFGDIVVFNYNNTEYYQRVNERWLEHPLTNKNVPFGNEKYILDQLFKTGMIECTPEKFCEIMYGYPPINTGDAIWPEFKSQDYQALTRVVKEIFIILELTSGYNKINLTELPKISFLQ